MEIKIMKQEFLVATKAMSSVINKRSPIPVLKNVCLIERADKLELIVSNVDMYASFTLPSSSFCSITGNFSTTVNCADLILAIGRSNGNFCHMRVSEEIVHIDDVGRLPVISADDFPSPPEEMKAETGEIAVITAIHEMRKGIEAVLPTTKDEHHFSLNGVHLVVKDSWFLESTDATRGARYLGKNASGCEIDAIIPKHSANALKTILELEEIYTFPMKIWKANAHGGVDPWLFGTVGALSWGAKLINSQFPNLQKVIDTEMDLMDLTIKKKPLINALKQIQKTKEKQIKLYTNEWCMRIENNSASIIVDIDHYVEKESMINLDINYLLDAVKVIPDETVRIRSASHGALIGVSPGSTSWSEAGVVVVIAGMK